MKRWGKSTFLCPECGARKGCENSAVFQGIYFTCLCVQPYKDHHVQTTTNRPLFTDYHAWSTIPISQFTAHHAQTTKHGAPSADHHIQTTMNKPPFMAHHLQTTVYGAPCPSHHEWITMHSYARPAHMCCGKREIQQMQ